MQIGSSSTYWYMVDYSNVPCNLYTADTIGGNPSVANVRHGTTFGPVGELVGTCYVPGAASVLAGVPVDATLGTATLTAADIQAAVSSQFASVTSAIAALHDFDPVADPVAHVILADTVTTLTNAPDVPGEGEIAQAVWEYMSTLLPDGAEAMLAEIAERAAAIAARHATRARADVRRSSMPSTRSALSMSPCAVTAPSMACSADISSTAGGAAGTGAVGAGSFATAFSALAGGALRVVGRLRLDSPAREGVASGMEATPGLRGVRQM